MGMKSCFWTRWATVGTTKAIVAFSVCGGGQGLDNLPPNHKVNISINIIRITSKTNPPSMDGSNQSRLLLPRFLKNPNSGQWLWISWWPPTRGPVLLPHHRNHGYNKGCRAALEGSLQGDMGPYFLQAHTLWVSEQVPASQRSAP